MKIKMVDNVTGREILANKAQANLLTKIGRARLAESEDAEPEESKPAKKVAKKVKKVNTYRTRDLKAEN